MSNLLDNRPKQTTSYGFEPSSPTIEDWMYSFYADAKADAEAKIRAKRNWQDEYCLSGRFSSQSRNVPRALRTIETLYLSNSATPPRFANISDNIILFLPLTCYHVLVGEIISAASAEYYYRYEKDYG